MLFLLNQPFMKKLSLALMCMAGLAIVVACGGKKEAAPQTGDEELDQKIEKVEKPAVEAPKAEEEKAEN